MSDVLAPRNQFNNFQTEKRMAAKYTRIVQFRQHPLSVRRKPNLQFPSQAARQSLSHPLSPEDILPEVLCSVWELSVPRVPLVQAFYPSDRPPSTWRPWP